MYLYRDGRLCRSNGVMCFSGMHFGVCPFLMKEAAALDINVFKDLLWDLINESNELDVIDIRCDDKENLFEVTVRDGSSFVVRIVRRK